MEYRCRVGVPGGQVTEETVVANSEAHVRHDLEQRGLCVLAIRPVGWTGRLTGPVGRPRRRVPAREFLMFNQELATLLKAGMPLVQSLDILRGRIEHPTFRSALDDIHSRVRSGSALSDAFSAHEELLAGPYIASLLAGEKSGTLDSVLRRFVSYMKVIGEVRRKTLSALVYPAVLIGLSLVVIGIVVLKVVPEFASFYDSFDATLPAATRAIVSVSTMLREHVFLIVAVAAVVGAASWQWLRRPEQRERADRLVLRLPWVGSTVRRFSTSQAARTLSTLLGGGLPLVSAIEIASRSTSNRFLARELAAVGVRVREGESFASALASRGVFPPVAVKMAEVGEATGALQDMLGSLADFYDEEIETDLGRFIALVEPALLIVMGLVIAGLLLALYMPLFGLTSVIGGPAS